jgi:phosphoglycerate kinase
LPTDFICADKFAVDANIVTRNETQGIDDGWLGLDIGPNTIEANKLVIARSKTVFWNGP